MTPISTDANKFQYDAAILGAGPGGYVCALECARLGLKTVLIEARELGGTCLNRGCVPTKTLLRCAEAYRETLDAAKFGVSVAGDVSFDFAVASARRDKVVDQLRRGIKSQEKGAGVEILAARGVLTGPNSIRIEPTDGAAPFEISAAKIVVATGANPAKPPIPGLDGPGVWTSDELTTATALPESVVIVGGGVIGVEFASLFGALGKKTTVLEALPGILPGVDPEPTKLLGRRFKSWKVDVETSVRVTKIDSVSAPNEAADGASNGSSSAEERRATEKGAFRGSVVVSFEKNGETKTVAAERCVVCVGRTPATRGIGLEAAGVATTARGFVDVDEFGRTNVPSVFAIGDATGKIQLAHFASAQGRSAARACAGLFDLPAKTDVVPSCVYASPELASVGLTEAAAKAAGLTIRVASRRIAANPRALAAGADLGLVKLVADADSGRILGAQLLGPRSTDLIAAVAVAMKRGTTAAEFASTICAHPTFAETIAETADDLTRG